MMNAERMNGWLSILANVGVLIGILFLAYEIQQNTDIIKAQTRDTLTQKQVDYFRDIGSDPNAIDIMVRGGSEPLTDRNEVLAFSFLMQANFRMWENEYYQYTAGLFEEAEFLPRIERWRSVLSRTPGRKLVWLNVREGYSPDFRELLDQLYAGLESESGT
jgi:hypothetical protein